MRKIGSREFNDEIRYLHDLALTGVGGVTSFHFDLEFREMVAVALAIYYQCKYCRDVYGKKVGELKRPKEIISKAVWKWKEDTLEIVLFLRLERRLVSEPEWEVWTRLWKQFATGVARFHPGLPCAIAYSIGIARNDTMLLDIAFLSLHAQYPDVENLEHVANELRDLTAFMKLATIVNRSDGYIKKQLQSVGVEF